MAVAMLILLLPAAYILIAAGATGLLIWHLKANTWFNPSSENPSFLGIAMNRIENMWVFDALILAWALLTVFLVLIAYCLVMPLVSRSQTNTSAIDVAREKEPFLHAFVARLSRIVGAPSPRVIRVDCRANASAGFHEGTAGMLGGRRVLTIGLPLAAGMNLSEFTGVLAHELGHFAQGTGTRLTFAIGAINGWLARILARELAWENRLGQVQKKTMFHAVVPVVRWFARATCRLLSGMLWMSGTMTASLMRQLEFNADKCQATVVGSECLGRSLERIAVLGRALNAAEERIGRFWGESRLVDDIPGLVMAESGRLPPSPPTKPDSAEQAAQARFATHPPDEDRVAAAGTIGQHGPFVCDLPATALFDDLETLCKNATWQHYVSLGVKKVKRSQLVSVADFLGIVEADTSQIESLKRYFQELVTVLGPLPIHDFRSMTPLHPDAAREEISALREKVMAIRDETTRVFSASRDAIHRLSCAGQAEALLRAGFNVTKETFRLSEPTLDGCRAASTEAAVELEARRKELAPALEALGRRLQLDLAHLASLGPDRDGSDATASLAEADRLVAVGRALGQALQHHMAGAVTKDAIDVLVANSGNAGKVPRFQDLLQGMLGRLWKSIKQIRDETTGCPYPFEDTGGPVPLWRHLVPELRGPKDVVATLNAYETLRVRLPIVYSRVLGRLAAIAETSERAMGFIPLPAPAPEIATPAPSSDGQAASD